MKLNGKVITTPYESATRYDPYWRVEIAKTWATTRKAPTDDRLADDKWIKGHAEYLIQASGSYVHPKYQHFATALDWYGGSDIIEEKFRIEPLLLTNVSYDVIAADMGDTLDPLAVETYEKLYYNIRDDKGDVSTSCYKRTVFAQQQGVLVDNRTPIDIIWRVLANQFGYRTLVTHWGWTGAHGPQDEEDFVQKELGRMLQVAFQMRILKGDMINLDLTSGLANYNNWVRDQREAGQNVGVKNSGHATVLKILGMHQPHMVTAAKSADEKQKMIDAWGSKIKAEKSIAAQVVNDMGPQEGIEYIEKLQDENFRKAK